MLLQQQFGMSNSAVGARAAMRVSPLFETLDDLVRGPEVVLAAE